MPEVDAVNRHLRSPAYPIEKLVDLLYSAMRNRTSAAMKGRIIFPQVSPMQSPPFPADEAARMAALRALSILDTPSEERFDRLTRIAKRMFSVSIAQVTLVDANRQWFKSNAGTLASETPRNISICAHAILGDDILHIEDARKDERFFDNPLVTGDPYIRFYAGCPLRVGGYKLGTLCLIDREPRPFGPDERQMLKDIAGMVEQELVAAQLASTDDLTQLTNRRGLFSFARHALGICKRLGKPATLAYFDLDDFKQINDNFGHAEGDRVLRTFADGLRSVFRESDVVARLGGDEFVILLTDTPLHTADRALARMRAWIDEKNRQENRGNDIRFSAGMIQFDPARHHAIEDLLAEADSAMYQDKALHRQQRANLN